MQRQVLAIRWNGAAMTEECLEIEFGGTSEITDDDKGFVCFSGGKDSTAMLLRMLELNDPENYPVNRIAFSDTTFEFQELYDYLLFIDCICYKCLI